MPSVKANSGAEMSFLGSNGGEPGRAIRGFRRVWLIEQSMVLYLVDATICSGMANCVFGKKTPFYLV